MQSRLARSCWNCTMTSISQDNDNGVDRQKFLLRLARDLPNRFFCYDCLSLDLRDALDPPGPAFQPKDSLHCMGYRDELGCLWRCVRAHQSYSGYAFKFSHLQLAMKRHFHGPEHGISADSLSLTEVQVSVNSAGTPATTLLSVEGRMCQEPVSLCLRIQQWALLRPAHRNNFLHDTKFVELCDYMTLQCSQVTEILKPKLQTHLDEFECRTCEGLLKCRHCEIESQLKLQDFGSESMAVIVTKWLDQGFGLTPTDIRWASIWEEITIGRKL